MRNHVRTFCRKCMSTLLAGEGVVINGGTECIECPQFDPSPPVYGDADDEWPMMSQADWRDQLNPNEGDK